MITCLNVSSNLYNNMTKAWIFFTFSVLSIIIACVTTKQFKELFPLLQINIHGQDTLPFQIVHSVVYQSVVVFNAMHGSLSSCFPL